MKTIRVFTGTPYDIQIGNGLLSYCGKTVAELPNQSYKRAAIITDDVVQELYGETLSASLKDAGFDASTFVFHNGEPSKCMDVATQAIGFLIENNITRSDLIVALGGGVVGDLAGFVASIYLRGIDYVQIPTTFLAAIDSSVGGKTAVNIPQGKNLVGSFWQPRLVVCDSNTLSTLTPEVFGDGVAEAIKYGCIWDQELFDSLSAGKVREDLEGVIARCVEIKAQVVAQDERDGGLRQILNFGHTVGHAVEKLSRYGVSHGKGVAIGMYRAALAGESAGITPADTAHQIQAALRNNDLPWDCAYSVAQLAENCLSDKKRSGNAIGFILLSQMGKAVIHKVPTYDVEEFLNA